jgi:HAD superfamily hydrolase (TIGR01549 family)
MLKLAIFDMDGTVFENNLNWVEIREQLKVKEGNSILQEIYQDGRIDMVRLEILENHEKENTLKSIPIRGVSEFLLFLKNKNIISVLVTNNNRENTDYLINKYHMIFDMVITREMKLWKPDPDAFLYVMNELGVKPEETFSIGDSHYDIKASRGAKIPHIFIIGNSTLAQKDEVGVVYFDDYLDLVLIISSYPAFLNNY